MTTRAERLASERNIWLATQRPSGRPHLAPIWFVFVDECVWVCTGSSTVKARNVAENPQVSFALEDGDAPVLAEGTAMLVAERPNNVVDEFRRKFDWDITTDVECDALLQITIKKWLNASSLVEVV